MGILMDNGEITHITLHQRNSLTLKIYHFDGDINRILSIRRLTGWDILAEK